MLLCWQPDRGWDAGQFEDELHSCSKAVSVPAVWLELSKLCQGGSRAKVSHLSTAAALV